MLYMEEYQTITLEVFVDVWASEPFKVCAVWRGDDDRRIRHEELGYNFKRKEQATGKIEQLNDDCWCY